MVVPSIFSLFAMLEEWEQPVQVIGLAASSLAAWLYLQRWYTINFHVLNEHTNVDYKRESRVLSGLDVLACAGGENIVRSISALFELHEGHMIGLWSSDLFRCESLALMAVIKSKSRVMSLDFRRIVWAENLKLWMKRLFESSNPIRAFMKEIITLVRDGGAGMELDDDLSEAAIDDLMVHFKILMAEKKYM
jgi:hypothetical protein